MTTSTAEMDPVRARRRVRMSRFLRILVGATALVHVPVALAVTEVAARTGWFRAPALVGIAWAMAGFVLFVGRARAGMPDRRRHPVAVWLFDIPYFIHWCAAVYAFIPSVVATVISPVVDLVRASPVHAPMAAYM